MIMRILLSVMMLLGLAGFGTIAFVTLGPSRHAEATAPQAAVTVTLVTAAHPLRAGMLLKPDDLAAHDVPRRPGAQRRHRRQPERPHRPGRRHGPPPGRRRRGLHRRRPAAPRRSRLPRRGAAARHVRRHRRRRCGQRLGRADLARRRRRPDPHPGASRWPTCRPGGGWPPKPCCRRARHRHRPAARRRARRRGTEAQNNNRTVTLEVDSRRGREGPGGSRASAGCRWWCVRPIRGPAWRELGQHGADLGRRRFARARRHRSQQSGPSVVRIFTGSAEGKEFRF